MTKNKIRIIGGGLAGCEAAFYLAGKGYEVELVDIKPKKYTPAHSSENFCELVCSNSLKSDDVYGNACGLLKEEMRRLGSTVIPCADETRVPAGNALAVDRDKFAALVTEKLKALPNVTFLCEEITEIDFSTIYIPPAVLIRCQSGVIKVDTSILDIPPAILICYQSGVIKVNFSTLYHKPSIFIRGKSSICTNNEMRKFQKDIYKLFQMK